MTRVLCLILIVGAMISGCTRQEPTATDLLAKLLAKDDVRTVVIYFNGAQPEGEGYLSLESEKRLYNGHDLALLSDEYAIALGQDDRLYEIHLYHALDHGKAEAIENRLRDRQLLLSKQELYYYDSENRGAEAIVWRKGKWVCLLVTDDNESMREILLDALK